MKKLLKKILEFRIAHITKRVEVYFFWTFPWREGDMCFFGLGGLRGDGFRIGLGLFFLELGVSFTPRILYAGTIQGFCTNCDKDAVLQLYKDRFLVGGTIVTRCTLCGDEVIDPNLNQEPHPWPGHYNRERYSRS